MTWPWWLLAALLSSVAAGRVLAWAGGPPEITDIRYRFNAWLPALIGWARGSNGNWCVTIGRVTFVRYDSIAGFQRAHELEHSRQAHRMSVPWFLAVWVWQCVTVGYRNAALEQAAEQYEAENRTRWPAVQKKRAP